MSDTNSNLSVPKAGVKSPSLDILETSRHQFLTLYCAKCGFPFKIYTRCGDRTCPECRLRDYYRLLEAYRPLLRSRQRLRLVTLTLRHSSRNSPAFSHAELLRLRNCLNRLLHQKYYRSRMTGGLISIEAKKKPGRPWNIHLHILVEGFFIPQQKLSQDWYTVTGDSFVVDIRDAYSGLGGLKYLLKYLIKAPEVSNCEEDYNEAFRGMRLISAFGTWYKLARQLVQHFLICPACGSTDWFSEYDLVHYRKFACDLAPP